MMIALCGCMMQEEQVVEKIRKSYRFVDVIFGTHNIFKLAELIFDRLSQKGMVVDVWKGTDQIVEDLPTDRKYPFNPASTSCSAAITSAATASSPTCGGGSGAGNRRRL